MEQWATVRQRASEAEYFKELMEKLSCLGRVPMDISLGIFINGLRGDIRSELRLMDPPNLKVALEWAEKIKEKDWAKASYGRHKEYSRNGPHYPRTYPKQITNTAHPQYNNPYPSPTPHQNSLTLPKNPPENLTKSIPLTDKELREKRARGLCFKCDEPWSFNHACKKRELRVILTEDDGEEEEDEGRNLEMAEMAEMAETQEIEIEDPMAGITLQSIPGFTKPKTMKLEGEMAGAKQFHLNFNSS